MNKRLLTSAAAIGLGAMLVSGMTFASFNDVADTSGTATAATLKVATSGNYAFSGYFVPGKTQTATINVANTGNVDGHLYAKVGGVEGMPSAQNLVVKVNGTQISTTSSADLGAWSAGGTGAVTVEVTYTDTTPAGTDLWTPVDQNAEQGSVTHVMIKFALVQA